MFRPEKIHFDRAEALERLGGDEALFASVADMFAQESANYCAALETALAARDAEMLRREAHTVKSMLATFSFEAGRELAQQLEQLAATGSLDGADHLTAEVVESVKGLAEVLGQETV